MAIVNVVMAIVNVVAIVTSGVWYVLVLMCVLGWLFDLSHRG